MSPAAGASAHTLHGDGEWGGVSGGGGGPGESGGTWSPWFRCSLGSTQAQNPVDPVLRGPVAMAMGFYTIFFHRTTEPRRGHAPLPRFFFFPTAEAETCR